MEFMIFGWPWQLWVGGLAGIFLAVSYLVPRAGPMRLLAVVAFALGALSLGAETKPSWTHVASLLGLAGINMAQLVYLRRKEARVKLSGQERALREWLFPTLADLDFQQLLRVSKRSYPVAGTFLVNQGEKLEELFVLIQGTAHVVANGMVVATLRDGSLIGEVSFFRDDVATASVVAQTDLSVLSIGRTQLRKLMQESQGVQRALHESIGRDLGVKLTSFDASRF